MPTTPLLPLPDGLDITSISETPEEVLVRVTSHRQSSPCPLCSTPSTAIHSYYRRKPMDLPCTGRSIRLLLSVQKFFCRVATCPRKIFTERLPEFIEAIFPTHEAAAHWRCRRLVLPPAEKEENALQASWDARDRDHTALVAPSASKRLQSEGSRGRN